MRHSGSSPAHDEFFFQLSKLSKQVARYTFAVAKPVLSRRGIQLVGK